MGRKRSPVFSPTGNPGTSRRTQAEANAPGTSSGVKPGGRVRVASLSIGAHSSEKTRTILPTRLTEPPHKVADACPEVRRLRDRLPELQGWGDLARFVAWNGYEQAVWLGPRREPFPKTTQGGRGPSWAFSTCGRDLPAARMVGWPVFTTRVRPASLPREAPAVYPPRLKTSKRLFDSGRVQYRLPKGFDQLREGVRPHARAAAIVAQA